MCFGFIKWREISYIEDIGDFEIMRELYLMGVVIDLLFHFALDQSSFALICVTCLLDPIFPQIDPDSITLIAHNLATIPVSGLFCSQCCSY